MFGARYHVALVGKGMVSNLIISPVSLEFRRLQVAIGMKMGAIVKAHR